MKRLVGEPTNMPKTILRQQITIDALPSKVWKVLTHPDYTCQYFFENAVNSDWVEGSTISSCSEKEQNHKGWVLEAVPGVLLKYSLQQEPSPANITTTYELIPGDNGVELKLHCEGFTDSDEEFLLRRQQVMLLLQKIKWLAEYS